MNNIETQMEAKLKKLFNGNNFSHSDYHHLQSIREQYEVSYRVYWSFGSEWSYEDYNGNASADRHFGNSETNFNTYYQQTIHQAKHDKNLRINFINGLIAKKQDGLSQSETEYCFHNFGTSAFYYNCSPCNGHGNVNCDRCNGRGNTPCHPCNQSGWVQEHNGRQWVSRQCHFCAGSGTNFCHRCRGSGTLRCSNCGGHGFLTRVYTIKAIATPRRTVYSNKGLYSQELINHLANRGCSKSKTLLPFHLVKSYLNNSDEWEFHYNAQAEVMQLDFCVQKKNFSIALLEYSLHDFVKAAVFDHLLRADIKHISSYYDKNKPLPRHDAKKYFHSFRKLPALDHAMQQVATHNLKGADSHQNQIINSCGGYISSNASARPSNALLRSMDVIVPTHSNLIWRSTSLPILLCILGYYAFLYLKAEGVLTYTLNIQDQLISPLSVPYQGFINNKINDPNWIEYINPNASFWDVFWLNIQTTSADFFVLGLVIAFASACLVFFKQMSVPPKYHRKMTNGSKLFIFMLRVYLASLMGLAAGYGIFQFNLWQTANLVHPLVVGYFYLHGISSYFEWYISGLYHYLIGLI